MSKIHNLLRKIACLLVATFCLYLLNGCAFGTRQVVLINSEPVYTKPKTQHNHEICYNGLSDRRAESTIGHVQNSYGTRTAEVVAVNNVQDWVNKEIKNQLAVSGYVVNENCTTKDNRLVIGGKIVKVYTTAYMTYLGEVTIKACITLDSTELLYKSYTGYDKAGTNWAGTTESFGNVLDISLKSAISQMIKDIDSIDNRSITNQKNLGITTNEKSSSDLAVDTLVVPDSCKCPNEDRGITIIRGKRSVSNVKSILDSIKTELNSVYRDRFELNSSLSGDVCVRFIITSDGNTKQVKIIRNSLHDNPMEARILSLLSNARFTHISSSNEVEVIYNFSFKAESARASKNAIAVVLGILAIVSLAISFVNLSRY